MSNTIHIKRTEFKSNDVIDVGVRVDDDYASGYVDTFYEVPRDNTQLTRKIIALGGEAIVDMLKFASENKLGLVIDDVFYDHEEIKDGYVFDGYENEF